MYAVVVDLATSLEKPGGKMDHHPGEATHDRAVDADELQITDDLELALAGRGVSVPAFDRAGDQVADLAAVVLDQVADRAFDPVVELALEVRFGCTPLTEGLEPGPQ